jgi:SAM-dependent methyltransferase
MTENRWLSETGGDRGESYAARFAELAASGQDMHGEARLVETLTRPRGRVLDAGCGTGRVAIELARRGFETVGVDLDESMLAVARADRPALTWREGDLATIDLGGLPAFDTVVLAGNVLIYVTPGTEPAVVATSARALKPRGLLVAGFQLRAGGYDLSRLDADAGTAGLVPVDRWATWDREPYDGGDYAVSVYRRPAS